jgi:hypothetical protein
MPPAFDPGSSPNSARRNKLSMHEKHRTTTFCVVIKWIFVRCFGDSLQFSQNGGVHAPGGDISIFTTALTSVSTAG